MIVRVRIQESCIFSTSVWSIISLSFTKLAQQKVEWMLFGSNHWLSISSSPLHSCCWLIRYAEWICSFIWIFIVSLVGLTYKCLLSSLIKIGPVKLLCLIPYLGYSSLFPNVFNGWLTKELYLHVIFHHKLPSERQL